MEGFIAPYGANRSKKRSLRSLFWNGGGEIYPFPEVLVISLLRFGILVFRRRCRASPEWDFVPHPTRALPLTCWGSAPVPASPFLRKKGLIPKTFLVFFLLPFLLNTKATVLFYTVAFFLLFFVTIRALLLVFHLLL